MKIGLRIDVDTFRGTKQGVPALCELLAKYDIKATFYFSVGPDNMGRNLWRLLKPAFFWKMLRTNAASLYGPEIIFRGTIWPGPLIGKNLSHVIKETADAGHEIGLHAWDHHREQTKTDKLSQQQITAYLKQGMEELERIIGRKPATSAVPGWRCNDLILKAKSNFPFEFNSDCRGKEIFISEVGGQIQIPVTMPTYDEVLGKEGINDDNYNEFMLNQLNPEGLNVLTIHAEAEGIKCLDMFEKFIQLANEKEARFLNLGELIENGGNDLPKGTITQEEFPGREGWLAVGKICKLKK